MTLQARLTLSSVLITTLIVTIVSVVDLGNDMERQFEGTLRSAKSIRTAVSSLVRRTVERERTLSLREALRQPDITQELVEDLTDSPPVAEIAVCDRKNEILVDTDPKRLGTIFKPYPDFTPVVQKMGWLMKLRILFSPQFYQIEQPLGSRSEVILYVRVVVAPALIRNDIYPALVKNASVAVSSVVGAVIITLVFSTLAFRSLGRLGKMLDLLASGQYDYPEM